MKNVARFLALGVVAGLASCEMNNQVTPQVRMPATNPVAAIGDANVPPPGTTGNAGNVQYIGANDPAAPGRPVRLAKRSGHVSNYDDAKIPPYTLPDLLVTASGRRVTTADQWFKQRRPEILKYYQEQIYGRIPSTAPKVTWEVAETDTNSQDGKAVMKRVVGWIGAKPDGQKITMTMYTPKSATGPVPIMLAINFGGGAPAGGARAGRGPASAPTTTVARRGGGAGPAVNPAVDFVNSGWGYASINNGDIQADNLAGLTSGAIGASFVAGQTERKPDEWGSIAAWAWGLSRCVDYFETDKSVNAKQVSVTGASRLGKTALWACANDERIAGACSIVSGEMGAALIRRDWGETLDDMAQNYPWQFSGNLQKYVGRWDELAIDNHMLIALCAPRLAYVNGGVQDQWTDPVGEFLSIVNAAPVYHLLGLKDLGTTQVPELDHPITSGDVAFHYHSGGHSASPLDYPAYRAFADRHFKAQAKN